MFLTSKMLLSGQQGLLFSFPLMEKKHPESIRDKLIRCRAFPITEVFLQRISKTTPLFERPKDEVFASCHAKTPVALCSILHALKQIEPDYRIEQGAGSCFQFPMLPKMLRELRTVQAPRFRLPSNACLPEESKRKRQRLLEFRTSGSKPGRP